tara:strand:- start:340 stop:525 length:186 start_codon:yes stop_codon:yes gene_type:complete
VITMARAGASHQFTDTETFKNSIGTWRIKEDGTVRLVSEEKQPKKVKVKRKWKSAGKEKRI